MRWSLLAALSASPLVLSALAAFGAAPSPDPVRVSGPVTHANLTVYFIHGTSAPGKAPLTLEEALAKQLCGQYLRARSARHGLLLLVHKVARKNGWRDSKTRRYLSFAEVVERLSKRAAQIRAPGYDSPKPEIAVLDVSGIQKRLKPLRK